MENVLEIEKTCDIRVKQAKERALETAAEADRQSERIFAAARKKAADVTAETAAKAAAEAEKIAAEGKRRADEAANELRAQAQSRSELAAKAVASMLLKIS